MYWSWSGIVHGLEQFPGRKVAARTTTLFPPHFRPREIFIGRLNNGIRNTYRMVFFFVKEERIL